MNIELGGGLHGVDRGQGDEDGEADQQVVREDIEYLTKLS